MAEAKPWTYLKTRVYRITKTYVLVCGFLLAWLDLRGLHIKWAGPPSIPAWALSGGTALATLLVILLDAVPGDHLKAALVFWRWNNPLPGCRAFLRTNLEKDSRISIERLRARLGGKFPRSPTEQNATWYRLYKSVSTEPEVAGLHYEYLLFRDLTWFTVVIAVLAILSLVINGEHRAGLAICLAIALVLFVLFSRAAAARGRRFVSTVLAVAAAKPEGKPQQNIETEKV